MINGAFNVQTAIEDHPEKWFSHKYGARRVHNKKAWWDSYLSGMLFTHLGAPYRKSTCEKVWNVFEKEMDETSSHRFRTPMDVMHQLFSL